MSGGVIQLQVPAGAVGGQEIQLQISPTQAVTIVLPDDVVEGSVLQINVPSSAPSMPGMESGFLLPKEKAEPPPPPPPEPPLIAFGETTTGTIALSWSIEEQLQNQAHSFALTLLEGPDNEVRELYSGTDTEFVTTELLPGTEYKFQLTLLVDETKQSSQAEATHLTSSDRPDTPGALQCTMQARKALKLRWAKPRTNGATISKFELVMYDKGAETVVHEGKELTKEIKKLQEGTAYKFRVRAFNAIGVSDWTAEATFATSAGAPVQPPPPALIRQRADELTVWFHGADRAGGAGALEHRVELADAADGAFDVVWNGAEDRYTIGNLTPNTEYRIRIAAKNQAGTSPYSDVLQAKTPPAVPDSCRPTDQRAGGQQHPYKIELAWEAPESYGQEVQYELSMRYGLSQMPQIVYNGPKTHYAATELLPGTQYAFSLRAVSRAGGGPPSEWCTFRTGSTTPAIPAPVWAVGSSPHSVQVNWTAPDPHGAKISQYKLTRCSDDLAEPEEELYLGTELQYEVCGLSPAESLQLRVSACNTNGWSGSSCPVTVTSAPDIPGLVDGIDAESHTRSSCTVSWASAEDNGSPLTGWLVMSRIAEGNWSNPELVDAQESTFTVKGMKPATAASFRVAALNAIGQAQFSEEVSCTSGASVPGAPKSVLLDGVTDSSFEVSWDEPAGNGEPVQFYRLQLSEADAPWSGIEYEGHERSYQAVGMETGVSYRVRVQAVNSQGSSPYSSVHAISTLPGKPDAPVGLTVVSATATTLKLKWRRAHSRGSAVVQYRVNLTPGSNGAPHSNVTTQGNILTCKFSKLTQLTKYQAAVSALSIEGEGEASTPITVSTPKEVVVVKQAAPEPILRKSSESEEAASESQEKKPKSPSSRENKPKTTRQRNFAHLQQIEDRERDERRKKERREASWRYQIGQFLGKIDSMYLAGGFVAILVIVMVLSSGNEQQMNATSF